MIVTGRNDTEYIYGTTDAGRYLLVILSRAMDGREHVVTARTMDSAERRHFTRQTR